MANKSKKTFDCIKFKNELQDNLLKNSEATNLQEYVNYVNKIAQSSSLHKVLICTKQNNNNN